jgi:hypothetical protein
MNDITVKSFSEKFSLNENEVLDLIEKTRKQERKAKKYAEISDKLKNLKDKYINKFCYFDNDIIIRITDITIFYGSFVIVGAGLIKNDICQQISIVPKYEKITKLTTYNNTVEELDDYINSKLISDVNEYIGLFLDKQAEFINATLLNRDTY